MKYKVNVYSRLDNTFHDTVAEFDNYNDARRMATELNAIETNETIFYSVGTNDENY